MSRKTWVLIITLVVGGVLLQIPAHSGMVMPSMDEPTEVDASMSVVDGSTRVDLEVTGMT